MRALKSGMNRMTKILTAAFLVVASAAGIAQPGGQRARAMHGVRSGLFAGRQSGTLPLPPGTRVRRDMHYGDGADETYDVYAPPRTHGAPVVFMVHGGGWRRGDKDGRGVARNKAAHWVSRGLIVVSVNYPMLPDTTPLQQARYVAKALAAVQRDASQWGGDPRAFVLMGHSAGAHLVSLISADPPAAIAQGALPWLGTVALDSAAFDVAALMRLPHLPLYDKAFGSDATTWAAVSPTTQLRGKIAPFLAVCSSQRMESCLQANAFTAKARDLGSRVEVLPQDLSHAEVNANLGLPSAYTSAVDGFLAGLSPALAARLR